MINKSKVFQKPKKMSAFIIMLFSLVLILASPNIAFARGSNQWPSGIENQMPPKNQRPYFWGEQVRYGGLTPEDIKVNTTSKSEVDNALSDGQKNYMNRGDLYYSCFNKFQLLATNGYGTVGYLTSNYKGYSMMPYIPPAITRLGVGGRVYHFFDYPGDTSSGGDDDFSFTFQVGFDDIVRQAAQKKGNLYVNLVVEALDTKGDHAHAAIFNYNAKNASYNLLAYLDHTENGKWKQWNSGWKELPVNASALDVVFYSSEGGGSDANDAELMMPRVLMLDNSLPKVESVVIQGTGLTSSKNNVYGNVSKHRAKVGDIVRYIVTFDEPVRCTDVSKPALEIESSGTNLIAKLAPGEKNNVYKKQFTFEYRLVEGDGILPSGRVVKILNADKFEDVGKNVCKEKTISNYINKNVICDSKTPVIDIDGQTSNNTVFYAKKMSDLTWSASLLYSRSTEGNNILPGVLKITENNLPGDRKFMQNTLFSLKSTDAPIFRVVLSDMIDNSLLKLSGESGTLTLKLAIFDSSKNKIQGKYAYAELIAYRYAGQDKNSKYQGTNEGRTELYFAYTPKERDFEGLAPDVYSVDIAATVSGGNFIFDENLFNKKLKDFAGNEIKQLTFPIKNVSETAKAPCDNIVMIDLKGPVLIKEESNLPNPEAPPVNVVNGIKLVFEEKSAIEKAEVQVVKRAGGTGSRVPVRTIIAGQGNTASQSSSDNGGISPAIVFAQPAKVENKYEVAINNLYIIDDNAAISDKYYLEYRVIDSAGNESSNEEEGFPLNLDILAPIPMMGSDGKWYIVNRSVTGETADVTFRLEEASGLADNFYYVLDYDNRNTFPKSEGKANTSTSRDSVTITSDIGTRQSITIWTKFGDILGNFMNDFIKTNPIHLDSRNIDAEYYCTHCLSNELSTLRKTYDVSVKINNNPFSDTGTGNQGTLKIKYKWLPRGANPESVSFNELSITSGSGQLTEGKTFSLTPPGFQQEWLGKLGIKGSVFQGYYSCYAKAELWAVMDGPNEVLVDEVVLYNHEHYFDNAPPAILFQPFSKAYSSMPVVSFSIDDDGSPASGSSNIDMNIEYTYYTYVVKTNEPGKENYAEISQKYPIYTTNFYKNENSLGGLITTDGKTVGIDVTEVYVKVSVQDTAGNRTDGIIGGPILIDTASPGLHEINLNIRDEAGSISYQDETGNYTVVKDLADITGAALNITDNTSADITVTASGGSKAILKCVQGQSGVYSDTINLAASDFYFVGKTRGSADLYYTLLTISDEAGNITYRYLHVIADNAAVYSKTPKESLSSNGDAYTPDNITARQYITVDDYEMADILRSGLNLTDPGNKVVGEPVIVVGSDDTEDYIELTLQENTVSSPEQPSDVYITITDAFGNISEKIYFIARGIDKTAPTLTVAPSPGNDQHEGNFIISASDNEFLIGVDAALVKDGAIPEENDYFPSVWPLSTLLTGVTDGSDQDIGYAPSHASLEISSASTSGLTGSFSYRCLPTGNYTLYIRSRDGAGNETISTHSFTADNKPPVVQEVSYSPSPDRKTGGTVSVRIETDQPVRIQKTISDGQSSLIHDMQDMIRDFMLHGFTYWYNGERKTLSLMDLELQRFNYWYDSWDLMDQAWSEAEIEVLATLNPDDYPGENIEEVFYIKTYALAMLKYMEALKNTGMDDDFYLFGHFYNRDESPPVEAEELKKIKDLLEELDVFILSDEGYDSGYEYDGDVDWESITEEEYRQLMEEAIIARVESYYIKDGDGNITGIDESIFRLQVPEDEFNEHIDPDDPDYLDLKCFATLYFFSYPEAIDLYQPETTPTVFVPGAPDEETDVLSANSSEEFSELKELDQQAVSDIQYLRQKTVADLAAKYADIGKAASDQSHRTENIVTYRNNAKETLYAVNKFGQTIAFDVEINHIDPSNAPVLSPDSVALVYRYGTDPWDAYAVTDSTVKNGDSDKIRFVADVVRNILNNGENENLYFFDFKMDGEPLAANESVTVSESVYDSLFFREHEDIIRNDFPDIDSMTFYKTFEAELNGKNGLVTFKYMDPSFAGQEGKIYWTESAYFVNVFDFEPPSGIIQYDLDPDRPTNKDIVARVVNIQDNRTDSSMIKVYYKDDPDQKLNTFTFSDNGSKTFALEDYAGNKTYLTAEVTGIDKTPPVIEGKFYAGGNEYPAEWDAADSVYKYKGPYTNDTVTAEVIDSDTGEVYSTYVFNDNDTVSFTAFDPAGNASTIELCVDRFDFTAPVPDPESIRYYVDGAEFFVTSTNKNVKVRFTVSDNITPDPAYPTPWVTVSGLDMRMEKVSVRDGIASIDETIYTDVELVKDLGGNLFELEFEYNGTAIIHFTDGVGNQAMITVAMDKIDKVPPSVKSEVRTSEKGVWVNKPVTVAVYPDELCDGWITDDDGNVLVPRKGLSTSALTYTFDEENDGNSNMVWFHFEDASNNQMTYQVTAYDIDLTKPLLLYELVAVNKGVPYDKELPVDKDEAVNQLIPYSGAATFRISVDPASKATAKGTDSDQFTGGIMAGDTIGLVNRPNVMYHTFFANGDYVFYYRDQAGNLNSLTLTVDCIDNNKPGADVSFAPDRSAGNTRENVVITISTYDIDADGNKTQDAYVYWNGKKYTTSGGNTFSYTVTDNGKYEFVVTDDSGNTNTIKADVDWIDKEAPVIQAKGYTDIYVTAGDADAAAVEALVYDLIITDNMDGNIPFNDARVTVNYYMSDGVTLVDINSVDFGTEGEYLAIVKARDTVGNEAQLPRRIIVLGPDDVLPLVNGQLIMPSETAFFYTGDLSLEVLNLEKAGGTVYYSFVKGRYHPAELKGFNKTPITTETNNIKLQTSGSGIYTLVIGTQERNTVVVYIYVASDT